MNELRQATDEEVAAWTAQKHSGDDDDIVITNPDDVDVLVGEAAGQVQEHGAAHLITQIAVWRVPGEAEALITLDLPSGIRLCTLSISTKHLIPGRDQAGDGPALIRPVLGNVLSAARALARDYETEVTRRAREAGMRGEIWVFRHEHNHGEDLSLHASREGALDILARDVRSRWDNITGMPGVPATADELDDETAIETYFRHRSGSESYSLYSDIVHGTSEAGTCPAGTDDQLSQLSDRLSEASQQIALLSMLAIARITRATLPEAAAVSLAWSDQGPYLIPAGGYLAAGGRRIGEDTAFSEDTLDNAISLYCARLGDDNEGTWQGFTSTGTPGQTYHLKLDDVLATGETRSGQPAGG
jgi:hypothetical protein